VDTFTDTSYVVVYPMGYLLLYEAQTHKVVQILQEASAILSAHFFASHSNPRMQRNLQVHSREKSENVINFCC